MDADGSGARAVVTGSAEDTAPSWSPDGDRLVVTRSTGEIVVARSDGSSLAGVPLDVPAAGATWSPAP